MSTATIATEAPKPQRILDIDPPEKPLPLPAMLKLVTEKHGKSLPQMVAEIARLSFGPGKVSTEEYFDLRLYDDTALAGQDKKSFLGMRGSKQVGLEANQNEHWFSVVSDKIVFYTLMAGYGFPTIKQRALYHPYLHMPAFRMLRKTDDIVQFLKTTTDFPLFGKPCNSSLSLGTVSIDGRDAATGELILKGGRRASPEALAHEISVRYVGGYMFQERLEAHPDMKTLMGDRIGTIRVYTAFGPKGPQVFRACWKVAAGSNRADNFWRNGNMLAAVTKETGAVTRIIRGTGPMQEEITQHPDTGATLLGTTVPCWQEALELARATARILPHVPLIGWDIAVTGSGPVLVEANNTPDFRLVEMCERRGAYDDELKEFLAFTGSIWNRAKQKDKEKLKQSRSKGVRKAIDSGGRARSGCGGIGLGGRYVTMTVNGDLSADARDQNRKRGTDQVGQSFTGEFSRYRARPDASAGSITTICVPPWSSAAGPKSFRLQRLPTC